MKKVEKEFTRCNFNHKQIIRKGNVAIYERQLNGTDRIHYEVVKIGKHNGYYAGTQFIEAAETYPGNSLWGLQGWTCSDINSAKVRFKQACKRFNKTLAHA